MKAITTEWLNVKEVVHKRLSKPCNTCGYCPYGALVEEFPIKAKKNHRTCEVFGHDCPAYYLAEKWK